MSSRKLHAVTTAFLMGAAVAAAGILAAAPAEAAVRPAVGNPLNEAKSAMAGGNCNAAMTAVHKAENAGSLTADEQKYIKQMKDYIATASKGACGGDTDIGAKAKFAADWRARKYRDVIADADILRKHGGLTANDQQVVAQAYYYQRDYDGCIRATRAGGGVGMLEWQMKCASEAHDDATYLAAVEGLVTATNKPEYWVLLTKFAQGAKALSDHQTLDVYRVKYMAGAARTSEDYFNAAQFALQFGFAAEARGIIENGIKNRLMVGDRAQRLLQRAMGDQASNQRNQPRTEKEARGARNGDLLVKLGEDYCGMGRSRDAVQVIQDGIAKGVSDTDGAQIRLGQAYYLSGQKPQAVAAFAKIKDKGNYGMVARLWTIYVRTH
jgi:hypothetical protein